ncbi:unnamed protein product [Adineta ricciae]|uniref:Uncharacterized protein n=1 Tax=Adineta ricciae TaxID=249248 RepID=A0A815UL29_ADIRI|nr:unnamed protein product [Adineta ricciae]
MPVVTRAAAVRSQFTDDDEGLNDPATSIASSTNRTTKRVPGNSDHCLVDSRQYWRKYKKHNELPPIQVVDIRQLAKVYWIFANKCT